MCLLHLFFNKIIVSLQKITYYMTNKIIHMADIHILNTEEKKPIEAMIESAIKQLYDDVKDNVDEDLRIVIVGDIFENKNRTSNEAQRTFKRFLNYIDDLCEMVHGKAILIAGNHDCVEQNTDRLDSISPTFETIGAYPNVTFADLNLNYKSGTIIDDDAQIIWAVYSIFDNYKRPEIEQAMEEYPSYRVVGLYHGEIVGATTDTGNVSSDGIPFDDFKNCDCVMAGHIHKYQVIKKEGIPFVYSSSLFQKNKGENVTGHGYVVWNMEDLTHELVEVENHYRTFSLRLSSYDDVKNDKEILINL